jgi:hypothetical protein
MLPVTGWREPISISGAGKVVDGILRQRPCSFGARSPVAPGQEWRKEDAAFALLTEGELSASAPSKNRDGCTQPGHRKISLRASTMGLHARSGTKSVTHDLRREASAIMRKLIEFDDDTFDKLKQLARDRMETLQDLADEAFADLLEKHGVPADLKDALRKSAKLDRASTRRAARPRSGKAKS